jgi:hypothetical protein
MGLLALGLLLGCGGGEERVAEGLRTMPSLASPLGVAAQEVQGQGRRLMVPENPTTVTVYTLTPDCEAYQGSPVQVSQEAALNQTIELILAEQTFPEFTLSGYRISVDPETQVATLDLRVARTSRRVLNSLSLCEQKALLGSLRETLVNHPDWDIERVDFTNRGYPLVL